MRRPLFKIKALLVKLHDWAAKEPSYKTLQRQLLLVTIALFVVTVVTTFSLLKIYDLNGDIVTAQENTCYRGNPTRAAIRDNANALAHLIVAVNKPPTAEERQAYEDFKAFAESQPNPGRRLLLIELQDRFEHKGTSQAFRDALDDLAAVNVRAATVVNCPDVARGKPAKTEVPVTPTVTVPNP